MHRFLSFVVCLGQSLKLNLAVTTIKKIRFTLLSNCLFYFILKGTVHNNEHINVNVPELPEGYFTVVPGMSERTTCNKNTKHHTHRPLTP